MSRIAARPIEIPINTQITEGGGDILVKGPKGEQKRNFKSIIDIKISDKDVTLTPTRKNKFTRSLLGTYASHIKNMIVGVNDGFEKKLIIEGVGFKATIEGSELVLNIGFSHQVHKEIPNGLDVNVEKNSISIKGIDKELVGSFAAQVRATKKPEPYKGKGIRYEGEIVRRKQGKKAVT